VDFEENLRDGTVGENLRDGTVGEYLRERVLGMELWGES